MVVLLERIGRVAPLGIRFHDASTGAAIPGGLEVIAYPQVAPIQQRTAFANASGVYVLQNLAGMREFEFGEGDDAFWSSPPSAQHYIVEVTDLRGRYLSCQFEADVPTRRLFDLPCLPVESPPADPAQSVPLFPSAARSTSGGRAVIRASLYDPALDRPAQSALLAIHYEGRLLARGVSDARGSVMLDFPYPEPIIFLPESPLTSGIALTAQQWTLQINAAYTPPPGDAERFDLCALLGAPPATLWSVWDDPAGVTPMSEAALNFGKEAILRTRDADSGLLLSQLFVTATGSPP
jgi:hypothetical protein